ncbi:hypothetical protein AA313_de0208959 [Arthrobotrys entomopaga]|nr:hypothetical protein AA313_de0208959 [Arthrobotrys entomopaga]
MGLLKPNAFRQGPQTTSQSHSSVIVIELDRRFWAFSRTSSSFSFGNPSTLILSRWTRNASQRYGLILTMMIGPKRAVSINSPSVGGRRKLSNPCLSRIVAISSPNF